MPVFMNVWAGSWLIASVCSERTMQMSSATVPMCGKSAQISWPDWPNFLNGCCGREAVQLLPLQLGDRLALGERLGHRLAVHLGQLGLVVERLQVRRPAGHVRKMTRLALGARCSGLTTPRLADGAAADSAAASIAIEKRRQRRCADAAGRAAEERAAEPDSGLRMIGLRIVERSRLVPRDRLVQIQQHAARRWSRRPARPGRDRRGDWQIADGQQLRGRRSCRRRIRSGAFRAGRRASCASSGARRARRARCRIGATRARSGVSPAACSVRTCAGERAGRFDVGRIVQQHERLLRRVAARPLDGAFLAAGGVEGDQAGVQERPLPVGVQAAAILALALVVLPFARGEVQVLPVAGRLIRLHARPADLGHEQAADRQGVVADQLGVEAEAALPAEADRWSGPWPVRPPWAPTTADRPATSPSA